MSFAKWRKCDFQVHSCRDPNWTGQRPPGEGDTLPDGSAATPELVDQERLRWADTFIDTCLNKGLQAVALTDHNEVVMAAYVRRRILERRVATPDLDLWFFPGMELTARSGVQAIILFDADLEDAWIAHIQSKLGIPHPAVDPMRDKAPKVTQTSCDYHEIGPLLDEESEIRGRYIVLPNVSDGGKHTVLYDGGHAYFQQMPYVGGYLDTGQTIDTLKHKNRVRLSGTARDWTSRVIYPIPTSDCRTESFLALGSNNTWIKLAEPTAEAIRQAFLAPKSRIRISPPQSPSLALKSIEIQGSHTISDGTLDLSSELNGIIGGRGSGKSTLLEYLGFALGRSVYDMPREDYSSGDRLVGLVKDTIIAKRGSIQIELMQDGARFVVTRDASNAYSPIVQYPNGSTQSVSVPELRDLFPAIIYAQGELAELGRRASLHTELTDLLQFVDPACKVENDRLLQKILDSQSNIRLCVSRQIRSWKLQAEHRKLLTERDAMKQRVTALEKALPALSESDQAILDRYNKASTFEELRQGASQHANDTMSAIAKIENELISKRELGAPAGEESEPFISAYSDFFDTLKADVSSLAASVRTKAATLTKTEADWTSKYKLLREARDSVLAKLSEHNATTTQIKKLRDEISITNVRIGELEDSIAKHSDASAQLTQSITTLRTAVKEHANQTESWASQIEQLSNNRIEANVNPGANDQDIREAIDVVSAKTGSQSATREENLRKSIQQDGAWPLLDKLIADCLAAIHFQILGGTTGHQPPKLDSLLNILGNTERIRNAVTAVLDEQRVSALASAVPKPYISLWYCDDEEKIAFEKASEGQRAAALLFMLLEQSGGPLIIDQPEGDLDNSIIADLTDKLHESKSRRQIIFASHNANIVVNGSSELVVGMGVNDVGKRSIGVSGAIDRPEVRFAITKTMEGGEKAFKDRLDKYGF